MTLVPSYSTSWKFSRRGCPEVAFEYDDTFPHCTVSFRLPTVPCVWYSTFPAGLVPTGATDKSSYHGAIVPFGGVAAYRFTLFASAGIEFVTLARDRYANPL